MQLDILVVFFLFLLRNPVLIIPLIYLRKLNYYIAVKYLDLLFIQQVS